MMYLIISLLIQTSFNNIYAAEGDCFYLFTQKHLAQTKDLTKKFECKKTIMKTPYNPQMSERGNLDEVYNEITLMTTNFKTGKEKPLCIHYSEWDDNTDYNKKAIINRLEFLKEKWCITYNPDIAKKESVDSILKYDNMGLTANFETHKGQKPEKPSDWERHR